MANNSRIIWWSEISADLAGKLQFGLSTDNADLQDRINAQLASFIEHGSLVSRELNDELRFIAHELKETGQTLDAERLEAFSQSLDSFRIIPSRQNFATWAEMASAIETSIEGLKFHTISEDGTITPVDTSTLSEIERVQFAIEQQAVSFIQGVKEAHADNLRLYTDGGIRIADTFDEDSYQSSGPTEHALDKFSFLVTDPTSNEDFLKFAAAQDDISARALDAYAHIGNPNNPKFLELAEAAYNAEHGENAWANSIDSRIQSLHTAAAMSRGAYTVTPEDAARTLTSQLIRYGLQNESITQDPEFLKAAEADWNALNAPKTWEEHLAERRAEIEADASSWSVTDLWDGDASEKLANFDTDMAAELSAWARDGNIRTAEILHATGIDNFWKNEEFLQAAEENYNAIHGEGAWDKNFVERQQEKRELIEMQISARLGGRTLESLEEQVARAKEEGRELLVIGDTLDAIHRLQAELETLTSEETSNKMLAEWGLGHIQNIQGNLDFSKAAAFGLDPDVFKGLDAQNQVADDTIEDRTTAIGAAYLNAAEIVYNARKGAGAWAIHVHEQGWDAEEADRQLAAEGESLVGWMLEDNVTTALYNYFDATDEAKVAVLYLQQLHAYKENSWGDLGNAILRGTVDPTMWVGIASGGTALSARVAAQLAMRSAGKHLLSRAMMSKTASVAIGASIGGALEGAITEGALVYGQQQTGIDTGVRAEYDFRSIMMSAGMGAAFGAGLGGAIGTAGHILARRIDFAGVSRSLAKADLGERSASFTQFEALIARAKEAADVVNNAAEPTPEQLKAFTDVTEEIMYFDTSGMSGGELAYARVTHETMLYNISDIADDLGIEIKNPDEIAALNNTATTPDAAPVETTLSADIETAAPVVETAAPAEISPAIVADAETTAPDIITSADATPANRVAPEQLETPVFDTDNVIAFALPKATKPAPGVAPMTGFNADLGMVAMPETGSGFGGFLGPVVRDGADLRAEFSGTLKAGLDALKQQIKDINTGTIATDDPSKAIADAISRFQNSLVETQKAIEADTTYTANVQSELLAELRTIDATSRKPNLPRHGAPRAPDVRSTAYKDLIKRVTAAEEAFNNTADINAAKAKYDTEMASILADFEAGGFSDNARKAWDEQLADINSRVDERVKAGVAPKPNPVDADAIRLLITEAKADAFDAAQGNMDVSDAAKALRANLTNIRRSLSDELPSADRAILIEEIALESANAHNTVIGINSNTTTAARPAPPTDRVSPTARTEPEAEVRADDATAGARGPSTDPIKDSADALSRAVDGVREANEELKNGLEAIYAGVEAGDRDSAKILVGEFYEKITALKNTEKYNIVDADRTDFNDAFNNHDFRPTERATLADVLGKIDSLVAKDTALDGIRTNTNDLIAALKVLRDDTSKTTTTAVAEARTLIQQYRNGIETLKTQAENNGVKGDDLATLEQAAARQAARIDGLDANLETTFGAKRMGPPADASLAAEGPAREATRVKDFMSHFATSTKNVFETLTGDLNGRPFNEVRDEVAGNYRATAEALELALQRFESGADDAPKLTAETDINLRRLSPYSNQNISRVQLNSIRNAIQDMRQLSEDIKTWDSPADATGMLVDSNVRINDKKAILEPQDYLIASYWNTNTVVTDSAGKVIPENTGNATLARRDMLQRRISQGSHFNSQRTLPISGNRENYSYSNLETLVKDAEPGSEPYIKNVVQTLWESYERGLETDLLAHLEVAVNSLGDRPPAGVTQSDPVQRFNVILQALEDYQIENNTGIAHTVDSNGNGRVTDPHFLEYIERLRYEAKEIWEPNPQGTKSGWLSFLLGKDLDGDTYGRRENRRRIAISSLPQMIYQQYRESNPKGWSIINPMTDAGRTYFWNNAFPRLRQQTWGYLTGKDIDFVTTLNGEDGLYNNPRGYRYTYFGEGDSKPETSWLKPWTKVAKGTTARRLLNIGWRWSGADAAGAVVRSIPAHWFGGYGVYSSSGLVRYGANVLWLAPGAYAATSILGNEEGTEAAGEIFEAQREYLIKPFNLPYQAASGIGNLMQMSSFGPIKWAGWTVSNAANLPYLPSDVILKTSGVSDSYFSTWSPGTSTGPRAETAEAGGEDKTETVDIALPNSNEAIKIREWVLQRRDDPAMKLPNYTFSSADDDYIDAVILRAAHLLKTKPSDYPDVRWSTVSNNNDFTQVWDAARADINKTRRNDFIREAAVKAYASIIPGRDETYNFAGDSDLNFDKIVGWLQADTANIAAIPDATLMPVNPWETERAAFVDRIKSLEESLTPSAIEARMLAARAGLAADRGVAVVALTAAEKEAATVLANTLKDPKTGVFYTADELSGDSDASKELRADALTKATAAIEKRAADAAAEALKEARILAAQIGFANDKGSGLDGLTEAEKAVAEDLATGVTDLNGQPHTEAFLSGVEGREKRQRMLAAYIAKASSDASADSDFALTGKETLQSGLNVVNTITDIDGDGYSAFIDTDWGRAISGSLQQAGGAVANLWGNLNQTEGGRQTIGVGAGILGALIMPSIVRQIPILKNIANIPVVGGLLFAVVGFFAATKGVNALYKNNVFGDVSGSGDDDTTTDSGETAQGGGGYIDEKAVGHRVRTQPHDGGLPQIITIEAELDGDPATKELLHFFDLDRDGQYAAQMARPGEDTSYAATKLISGSSLQGTLNFISNIARDNDASLKNSTGGEIKIDVLPNSGGTPTALVIAGERYEFNHKLEAPLENPYLETLETQ